jgi:hypothetical protein
MAWHSGYGSYNVDPMAGLTGAFGSMGIGQMQQSYRPTGYYMPPAPAPRVKYIATFKKGAGQEEKRLDINGLIRLLDMPPAALNIINIMCDFPNGDTIELHVIYTHKGRREAGSYQFHIVAMYHYNAMNRPYSRNPDGSVVMLANGTPDRIDSIFIKLPTVAVHDSAFVLNVIYSLLGGYLLPEEQNAIGRRLGGGFHMIHGLLDGIVGMRTGGRRKRGRSMTRKGKGKRRATRRSRRV